MNKEILKWINKNIKCKAYDLAAIKRCKGPICINPDPIKTDLKILNQIKKELEEKDKLEQKQMLNSREEEPMEVPVLDDVEKRYLKNVIRPFKDRVKSICVFRTLDFEEYKQVALLIKIAEDDNDRSLIFPYFTSGTMYKGMKLDKYYTLEELGITYEEKE